MCRCPRPHPAPCLAWTPLLPDRSAGKFWGIRSWTNTKLDGDLPRRGSCTSKPGEEKGCAQVCGKHHKLVFHSAGGSRWAGGQGHHLQGYGPWERTNARSYSCEGPLEGVKDTHSGPTGALGSNWLGSSSAVRVLEENKLNLSRCSQEGCCTQRCQQNYSHGVREVIAARSWHLLDNT